MRDKLLRRIFGSRAKPKALPSPNAESHQSPMAEKAARKLFEDSRHGYKCRTIAFEPAHNPENKRIWRKALYTGPLTRWQIMDVIQKQKGHDRESGCHHQEVASGLNFIDAAENLAEFENGNHAPELEMYPAGPTAEELGYEHHRAFGEREGLAYDVNHRPHPTLYGEIVTEGEFTHGGLARARAHKKTPGTPLINGEQNMLGSLYSDMCQSEDEIEQLFQKHVAQAYLAQLIQNLHAAHDLIECCFTKQPLADKQALIITTRYKTFSEYTQYPSLFSEDVKDKKALNKIASYLEDENSPEHEIEKRLASAQNLIEKLPGSPDEKQALWDITHYYATLYNLMAARYMTDMAQNNVEDGPALLSQAKIYLKSAEKHFNKGHLSTAGNFDYIRSYIFAEHKGPLQTMPPESKALLQKLDDQKEEHERNIKNYVIANHNRL